MILDKAVSSSPRQLDLTPLINVVFLILIFFMLAGSIKAVDPIQAAKIEAQAAVDAGLLIVSITQEGTVKVEGQTVSESELLLIIKNHQTSNGRIGVKPDARLPAERLVALMAVFRQAGFAELTLITRNP